MIRINAFLTVKERHISEIKMIADQMTEVSLQDDGCKGYDFFQSVTRPTVFLICETWRDQAAYEAHISSPNFQHLVPLLRTLCEDKVEIFER